jgi:hypothetical protein
MIRWLQVGLIALVLGLGAGLTPAEAYIRPATTQPSTSAHYVYNCHSTPTIQIDLSRISGPKDVYVHNDTGYWLIAQNVTFDPTKVYDGLIDVGYIMQTSIFLTAPGVGPYDEGSRSAETVATGFACPYWGDVPYVYPSPPAGSVQITFTRIEQFSND